MTLPGRPVGAGRALTVGENEGPAGETAFSVGLGAFDGDAGALVLCDGASVGFSFSLVALQPASAPMPTMATAPVASANCLVTRADIIVDSPAFYAHLCGLNYYNYTSLLIVPVIPSSRTGGDPLRSRRDDRDDARVATPQAGQNAISGTTRSQ